MARSIRKGQFFTGNDRNAMIANSVPSLFILMTLASPVVWEHHAVFVALPFLLMLRLIEIPHEWMWFGFAYLLEFNLPSVLIVVENVFQLNIQDRQIIVNDGP